MKMIVKYFAKKYAIGIVNDMLDAASRKVDLETWRARVKKVVAFCQMLLDKLEDNKLTQDEIEQIADAAAKLVK